MSEIAPTDVGIREARTSFTELVNRAQYGGEVTVICRRGTPAAMLIPAVHGELRSELLALLARAYELRRAPGGV